MKLKGIPMMIQLKVKRMKKDLKEMMKMQRNKKKMKMILKASKKQMKMLIQFVLSKKIIKIQKKIEKALIIPQCKQLSE